MRKYIHAVCIPLWLVPMLTACEVHFGDVHYSNVPWWVIAIPTVLLLLFVWCAEGKAIAGRKHYCPKCGETFYPKWWKAAFTIHINGDGVFRCPHCGWKGFCHISHEQ